MEQLGEHGVVIRTVLRTAPGAQWEVAREFRRRIKNRLDAEGHRDSVSPANRSCASPRTPRRARAPAFPGGGIVTLRLHNTMTRSIQDFEPVAPGRVTLYSCGPTVWNYAHIGNFRTFLFVDLLRRWLTARGHEVYHIMNLTDVDDRIITESGKRGITIAELVAPFITAFHEDREYLRIVPAHDFPRATEHVESMVQLVEGLLAKGTAYRGDDGSVYFGIDRFPAYGHLSQLDRRELKAGASGRVSTDEYDKENARDFVLWKAAKPEDEAVAAAWDAPFGRGRPGWHLECSAMALELIGRRYGVKVLDIHTGGVDLIFPHHEDEIAQSCAYTGESDFARVWMHAAFLRVRGTKMSKRFGNITTARDLRQDGVDPGAIRLLVYQTHYRQELDLTDEALAAAGEGAKRLGEFARRLEAAAARGRRRGLLRGGRAARTRLHPGAGRRLERPARRRRGVRLRLDRQPAAR